MEGCDYEVFLSFRGPDTRKGITDHLYTRLIEAGVRTYKDNEDLRIGEEIGPELLEAIEQSKISIPILSKSYASSKWCLMELTKMVECRKKKGQIIMPIFYYVNPSELRHQNGGYSKALPAHKRNKRVDNETIGKWRAALSEVGRLKGWHTSDVSNRFLIILSYLPFLSTYTTFFCIHVIVSLKCSDSIIFVELTYVVCCK
ncbi:uncharacterized protein J3R85_012080 [Psidium guajava]|nr:uncharacterized protein J3R85_012080 [Psidium guajava]